MHAPVTFELRISFESIPRADRDVVKQRLVEWLLWSGVDSFVEGALDVDLDPDFEHVHPQGDHFGDLGGNAAPISIYKYSLDNLTALQAKITEQFSDALVLTINKHDTQGWMEGWKESFTPFATKKFCVCPPWDTQEAPGKISVIIEPGMAFGTGQHETTRLCLQALEELVGEDSRAKLEDKATLDVGTGTAILAIAASKLGFGDVTGTDIEDDAILAAADNAKRNQVTLRLLKGSIPGSPEAPANGIYDLVFANILAVVILELMPKLAGALKLGGDIIFSGLLTTEEQEVLEKGQTCGLKLVSTYRLNDWACLHMKKIKG